MQIVALTDEISALTERHEEIVREALADGIVTEEERVEIIGSARRVRLAAYCQAARTRIAIRLIRGGKLHRELTGEIRDIEALLAHEKATNMDQMLVA